MRAAIVGICVSGSVALAAALAHGQAANPSPAGALPPWRVPDIAALPDDDFGKAARYGRALIQHTSALIGPDAADPAMRFSGNGLECKKCHLGAGTGRFALPLVGVWGSYPAFSARQGKVQTIADRINDCMLRSMNGRALPQDSREMRALKSYTSFLASDQPTASPPVGRGVPGLPLPDRAADPTRGAAVYDTRMRRLPRRRRVRRALFPGRSNREPAALPVSATLGARQLQQRRRDGPQHHRGVVRGANMPRGIAFAYPIYARAVKLFGSVRRTGSFAVDVRHDQPGEFVPAFSRPRRCRNACNAATRPRRTCPCGARRLDVELRREALRRMVGRSP